MTQGTQVIDLSDDDIVNLVELIFNVSMVDVMEEEEECLNCYIEVINILEKVSNLNLQCGFEFM